MTRFAGILLLAVLLVASVPLRAGPQEDLRGKLEELQRLLGMLDDKGDAEEYVFESGRTAARVFNVADLTVRLADYVHPNMELKPAGSEFDEEQPLFGREDEGEMFFVSVEELMDLVFSNVRPDFWESGQGRMEYAGQNAFLVVAPPAVLADVSKFLDGIRESVGRVVTVEVRVVEMPAGTRPPARLGRAQVLAGLPGAKVLASARISGFNGQRVSLFRGQQQAFVQDYDVEVAQSSSIGDPIISVLQAGLSFDVRAMARGDDLTVVDIRGQLASPDNEMRVYGTTSGPVQAPNQSHVEFAGTLAVGADEFTVLSAGSRYAVLIAARSERLTAGGAK